MKMNKNYYPEILLPEGTYAPEKFDFIFLTKKYIISTDGYSMVFLPAEIPEKEYFTMIPKSVIKEARKLQKKIDMVTIEVEKKFYVYPTDEGRNISVERNDPMKKKQMSDLLKQMYGIMKKAKRSKSVYVPSIGLNPQLMKKIFKVMGFEKNNAVQFIFTGTTTPVFVKNIFNHEEIGVIMPYSTDHSEIEQEGRRFISAEDLKRPIGWDVWKLIAEIKIFSRKLQSQDSYKELSERVTKMVNDKDIKGLKRLRAKLKTKYEAEQKRLKKQEEKEEIKRQEEQKQKENKTNGSSKKSKKTIRRKRRGSKK